MEVIRPARPLVIDDTVGNPRSLEAVFETIRHVPHTGRLRVLFGIRGMRGPEINMRLAAALAQCIAPHRAHLVVTSSEDVANGRNRVLAGRARCLHRQLQGLRRRPRIRVSSRLSAVPYRRCWRRSRRTIWFCCWAPRASIPRLRWYSNT
jgi:hypothetical protein